MAFDLGLENKVVVITGGATGIGFATGLEFARQGAHVAICGRSEAKLAKAREAFAAEGFELFTEALDVCDAEKLYAFGDHVIEKFGRLDVWMNNAGIAITKPLLEFTEEEWNRVLDLNLNAVFHGSQYAARKMIALGNGGVILNAGSFQALMPAAAAVPYGTTKAAVVMFSRTFAAEMAPYNIRVLSYIPGVISTPMAIDWLNETDQIRKSIACLSDLQPAQPVLWKSDMNRVIGVPSVTNADCCAPKTRASPPCRTRRCHAIGRREP